MCINILQINVMNNDRDNMYKACSLYIDVFFLSEDFNQCIKLFGGVSREAVGHLCWFDCSVINLWNVTLITVWDLESHFTHSQCIKLGPLRSSALVLLKKRIGCAFMTFLQNVSET